MKHVHWNIFVAIVAFGTPQLIACSSQFSSCEARRTCSHAGRSAAEGGSSGEGGSDAGEGGSADDDADAEDALGGVGGVDDEDPGAAAGSAGASSGCGDGEVGSGEQCDQGAANNAEAYGPDLCTDKCQSAPFCGDGVRNGAEACDDRSSGSTALGACNPECTGYYEKKFIRRTFHFDDYSTNLGDISGADMKCAKEFGDGWKALLVGASRRATVTPCAGDQQLDWVIRKYTHYYNSSNELIWRTDGVSLLGVRDGKRVNTYAPAFPSSGTYPWSGYKSDWTTFDDSSSATTYQGTCNSWTSVSGGWGSFIQPDLMNPASEACGATAFILCVEQ